MLSFGTAVVRDVLAWEESPFVLPGAEPAFSVPCGAAAITSMPSPRPGRLGFVSELWERQRSRFLIC